MNCLSFLSRVLPDQAHGKYIGTYRREGTNGFWNEAFTTLEELAQVSIQRSTQRHTAYYALGTFTDNVGPNANGKVITQRRAHQATAFKTLALDVDCGPEKPYANQREGLAALVTFFKVVKLPQPMIVSSGNGLHCYWTLFDAIDTKRWVRVSHGLKALCQQHKFEVDWSKIHDASMVLRPVETVNFRGNHTVQLLRDAGPFDIDELEAICLTETSMPPAIVAQNDNGASSVMDDFMAGTPQYAPSDPMKIVEHCEQIRKAVMDGGEKTDYPLWRLVLGVATGCQDPTQTAIEWSRGHPTYDENKTITLLEGWKTPPTTCKRLDETVPNVCKSCPHFGVITSPAQLGAPRPARIELPPEDISTARPATDPPAPYTRTVNGVFTDGNGISIPICEYDLFPVQIVRDPGNDYGESVWMWNKPHAGYVRMRIRLSLMFNDKYDELIKCLSDNGLFLMSQQRKKLIGGYMRAYVQQLQREQASTELHDSFGWKDDFKSFVLGTTELRKEADGTISSTEIGLSKHLTFKEVGTAYHTKGSRDLWWQWTKALAAPSMELHAFALGGAFAAPLVAFTTLSGSIMSLVGTGGEGKSTILEWINSVYGFHKNAALSRDSTLMSIAEHMGMVCNLPVTLDEMTRIDPNTAADLFYWASQGQDKRRVTTARPRTWATSTTVAGNRSLRDMVASTAGDTTAISMRMLEFNMPANNAMFGDAKSGNSKSAGVQARRVIFDNYGYAGREYLAVLLKMGKEEIQNRIEWASKLIEENYGVIFTGEERFWKVDIVLRYVGLLIAYEANIIRFHPEAGLKYVMNQIFGQRAHVQSARMDTFDMLSTYLNEHNGSSLTVFQAHGKIIVQDPLPRFDVRVRKDVFLDAKGVPEKGFISIDRFHLRQWLVKNGFDMKQVLETIKTEGCEYQINASGRMFLGRDTPLKLGQVLVLGLNMNHPRFRGMLDKEADLSLMPFPERAKLLNMQ